MKKRMLGVLATLVFTTTISPWKQLDAAPIEAKVDLDIVAMMKEFSSWISSAWGTWDESKKAEARYAIPRITKDLLQLAAVKDVLANDLRLLIPVYVASENLRDYRHLDPNMSVEDRMYTMERNREEANKTVSDARILVKKAEDDARQLARVLSRLQTHIEDIDPMWSEKNIETQSAVFSISEGYGTLMLRIDKVNRSVAANEYESGDENDLSLLADDLNKEANHLREIAKQLADTQH